MFLRIERAVRYSRVDVNHWLGEPRVRRYSPARDGARASGSRNNTKAHRPGYRHADGRIRRVLLVAPEWVDGDAWRGVVSRLAGAALVAEASGEAVGMLAPLGVPDPMLARYRGEGRCWTTILHATGDIRKVSLWLGHAEIRTTEAYLRASPAEKLAVLEANVPPSIRPGIFSGAKDDLMRVLGGK